MSKSTPSLSRRRFLGGAALGATALTLGARRASAQAKPTITYWNGLTGADGKIMDELIDQFTRETGIRMEQQRIVWADLYAKLQVAVPADEGPDLALIHTVEIPHFASDGILEPMADATASGKGFKGEDYLPSTWQGGLYQGKRYAIPLDVPQHLLYVNVKVMRDAGLAGPDGKPKVPATRDEVLAMAQADHEGRHLRLRHRHRQPRPLHLGLPQPPLAERRERLRGGSQEVRARGARGDRGRRVLERDPEPAQDRAARRTPTAATRSSPASSASGSPAPGTSRGCARPRSTSSRRRCRASSSRRSCGRCRTSSRSRRRRRSTPRSATRRGPTSAG